MRLRSNQGFPTLLLTLSICLLAACETRTSEIQAGPHLTGGTDVERGRYLVVLGGCNDCHTDGYLQTEGAVSESQWLLGSPVGFRGPWGTTYPSNLRRSVQGMTEDDWVSLMKTRKALPPMPWMNVNQMAESDLRVVYRYLASLGAEGEVMPAPLPPDVEPTTPFIYLVPVVSGG